jgi:hypothetical protein
MEWMENLGAKQITKRLFRWCPENRENRKNAQRIFRGQGELNPMAHCLTVGFLQ